MATTIDSCQEDIFQLYIVQGKTLDQVRETLRREKGLDAPRKALNTKIGMWGYRKKYKRSEYLVMLREQTTRGAENKKSSFTCGGRSIDVQKVESYAKRERLHLLIAQPLVKSNQCLSKDLICRTPAPCLPQSLSFAGCWRAPEKLLHDIDILIKGSFETGIWTFHGNNQLINCGITHELDLTLLNTFLGNMKIGCRAAHNQSMIVAGKHWRQAFLILETLVNGRYFNILPNVIQQINDIHSQGFPDLARQLRDQIANLSLIQARETSMSSALASLKQIDMDFMKDVEQRLMELWTELFERYLGSLCYNSFVMTMETARRRLLQDFSSALEDHLPSISQLDAAFGPSDRRPLDAISVRLEILHRRGLYTQAETEAWDLILRAQMIADDEWQRLYHLTRGWYYFGCAQYLLGVHDLSFDSLTNTLKCEEELSWRDSFNIFEAEKVIVRQYLSDRQVCSSAKSKS